MAASYASRAVSGQTRVRSVFLVAWKLRVQSMLKWFHTLGSLFIYFFIALTADVIEGVPDECMAAGMNCFLSKPIRCEAMRNLLDAAEAWRVRARLRPSSAQQGHRKSGFGVR